MSEDSKLESSTQSVSVTQESTTVAQTTSTNDDGVGITAQQTKVITDKTTTVETTSPSGQSWVTETREKVVSFVSKIFPASLKVDSSVIREFDKLDDKAKQALNDQARYPELQWDASVRCSLDICDEEKQFIRARKEFIRDKFAKYIGVDVDDVHVDDIPIIGFGGSGGGFRAMIATTGYVYGLQKSGLYDCGTYYGGVSGSCWNLAAQYTSIISEQDNPLEALIDHFKKRLDHHIANPHAVIKSLTATTSPEQAVELVFGGLAQKKQTGLNTGIIDIYGALLATRLLLGNDPVNQTRDFKLSEQKRYLKGGKHPMPIYTALHHSRPWKDFLKPEDAAQVPNYKEVLKEHQKIKDHYRWFEFTPFEIGCDEIPAFIPSWAFGRRFEFRKSIDRVPEQNFGLEIGVFGAAPCAPIIIDIRQIEHVIPEGWLKNTLQKSYDGVMEDIGEQRQWKFEGHHVIPEANNHNFFYHLDPPPYKLGTTNSPILHFIDAGASNDLPLYPLTHPGRKVDIIMGFDSSSQIIESSFFEEEQKIFTSRRGINSTKRQDLCSKYLEVYDYEPNGNAQDGYTPPMTHPATFLYLPFLPNDKVDPTFVPSTAKFCAFNNFTYTSEQIDLIVKLALQNWSEVESTVKNVIKGVWEKKRAARLGQT
ncbi:1882_t:CDS:10 [Paraglomus occultum]|uniref:Lysophospholipase n=1 Tax=Paraglomus occultum TaxID=144539 RepID=A0A9N9AYN8_9GLOM|nr:1882_t:CDS:10 [Paraglomus occultum]